MSTLTVNSKGDWSSTTKFLNRLSNGLYMEHILAKYGEQGVNALSKATPRRTGKTAGSWYYNIVKTSKGIRLEFCNSNIADPTNQPIAILIQYGHLTKNGYFIEGRDYINPALRPIFDSIAKEIGKEVSIG